MGFMNILSGVGLGWGSWFSPLAGVPTADCKHPPVLHRGALPAQQAEQMCWVLMPPKAPSVNDGQRFGRINTLHFISLSRML